MVEIKTINTEIVVIGAGIAGLWLTNVLKNNGIDCILLESDAIGAKQTINSQGMLHSGVKYALQGKVTSEMQSISDSEALLLWQQAFNGQSIIKLTANCKLIDHQYLWSNSNLSSKVANFFVSNLLKSKVEKINVENYPQIFKNTKFTGSIYKLYETVLNLPIVLQELFGNVYKNCLKIDGIDLELIKNDSEISKFFINIAGERILLSAKQYIFTAGEGIQKFSNLFKNAPQMQVRPLHMVAVKSKNLPLLYGHNIDLQAIPIVTISSHKTLDNQIVWYCGGKIAEDGVNKNTADQILVFKKTLNSLFPWLAFNDQEFSWGGFHINRAEYLQSNGKKPNTATWFKLNNAIFAWPTKLVLAPMMAMDIFKYLQKNLLLSSRDLKINSDFVDFFEKLPKPSIAIPFWDNL